MNCSGYDAGDRMEFQGTYTVQGHPPWGWRTILDLREGFHMTMYNISPEGASALAVDLKSS